MGPSDLDLWQFDGWSDNGKGGIYVYNDRRCQTPWGDTRPDYGRPEVVSFLRDNARYGSRGTVLDGLRWDATDYIGNDDDNVLACYRWNRGGPRDDVVVVLNLAHRTYHSYHVGPAAQGPVASSAQYRLGGI